MSREDNLDRGIDIVLAILNLVATREAWSQEKKDEYEEAVRETYVGVRPNRVALRPRRTSTQRQKIVNDSLAKENAAVPTDRIAEANGIHRSTLYRYYKRRGA